jgi:hypothetical protein
MDGHQRQDQFEEEQMFADVTVERLLTPSINGLSEEEEAEFQRLSHTVTLDSKQLYRFRRLRAQRWRPDANAIELLQAKAPEMMELLKKLLANYSDVTDSKDWKAFLQEVQNVMADTESAKPYPIEG